MKIALGTVEVNDEDLRAIHFFYHQGDDRPNEAGKMADRAEARGFLLQLGRIGLEDAASDYEMWKQLKRKTVKVFMAQTWGHEIGKKEA